VSVDHSRSLKLMAGVSGNTASDLEAHLEDVNIVVSVDPSIPLSVLTTRVLLTTLRRGLGQLYLLREDGMSDSEIASIATAVDAIDTERPLLVIGPNDSLPSGAFRVHVGPTIAAPAIRIVPEGYGAHITNSAEAVIQPTRPANAIGAIYTAALGAAEVFKIAAQVVPDRLTMHDHLQFCPLTLTEDLHLAPDLPESFVLDLMLVGIGAIGTGIVLLLSELPAEGRLIAVDPQEFADENVATYSIGDMAEVGALKVDIARDRLTRFDVTPIKSEIGDLISAIDEGEVRCPATVLTALDSPEARRDAQRLWPDHLIDGQTGDTTLGICDHRHSIDPCLICLFSEDRTRPSGAEWVADSLGLPADLLADGDAILTLEHLDGLSEEQQERLRPHLGKPVCGLARATGLTDLDAGTFMPSIPFVSLQAACLAVSRMVAANLGYPSQYNFVQQDGLVGPQAATLLQMKPRADCVCQARSATIETVRTRRRGVTTQP
jgi:hypothetical protein